MLVLPFNYGWLLPQQTKLGVDRPNGHGLDRPHLGIRVPEIHLLVSSPHLPPPEHVPVKLLWDGQLTTGYSEVQLAKLQEAIFHGSSLFYVVNLGVTKLVAVDDEVLGLSVSAVGHSFGSPA